KKKVDILLTSEGFKESNDFR
nr:hypothetical protein [Tanacetum cinerariifolium]